MSQANDPSLDRRRPGARGASKKTRQKKSTKKNLQQWVKEGGCFLLAVLEQTKQGIVVTDLSGKMVFLNSAFAAMHDFLTADLLGQELSMLFHREKIPDSRAYMRNIVEQGGLDAENWHVRRDGVVFPIAMSFSILTEGGDQPVGIIGACRDITEFRNALTMLRESERRYRTLIAHSKDAIFQVELDGRISFASPACKTLFGYNPEEFITHDNLTKKIVHPDYRDRYESLWRQYRAYGFFPEQPTEWAWIHRNGRTVYTEIHIANLFDHEGRVAGFQTFVRNITERKQLEQEWRRLATTDGLTHVYNRRAGLSYLRKQLRLAASDQSTFTVCFVDLNHFKEINDRFGHQEGDEVLRIVSRLFRESLRETDIICRFGGDEFMVVLPCCPLENAGHFWNRIQERLARLNSGAAKEYRISLSRGFAEFDPQQPMSLDELIAAADRKMYENKNIC
jgi:diguanylate cyclase (GGDEF)-like protein/PAS domain S-box-containing protein